jgi:hypothetical protein
VKFVVRLPSRRVGPVVETGTTVIAAGRTVSIAENDVIGFVAGYAAAHGVETVQVVDDPMPERHRRMQVLRWAQEAGLLTYLGIDETETDETSPDGRPTP